MPDWSQHDIHKHMHVYSADNTDLGHVAVNYEDSFLIHKGFCSPQTVTSPTALLSRLKMIE
jgi:hypothetical protein